MRRSPRNRIAVLALIGAMFCCAAGVAIVLGASRLASPAPAILGAPPFDLPGAVAVRIPSESGSLLRGWWVPGASDGAVVLLHGVRSNRLSLVRRGQILSKHGYSVLLIDFQAHGESPGARITFGHLEALDAAAAVGFARARCPGQHVGAIGLSLGGAAALVGPRPLAVDALVLEAVYPDIDAALANRLRAHLGHQVARVLSLLLVPGLRVLLPLVLGVKPGELRPIEGIRDVRAPLLIASGTVDDRTLLTETRALFERAPQPKQLWEVEGAAHVDLERHGPQAYWNVIMPFLTKHLRSAERP